MGIYKYRLQNLLGGTKIKMFEICINLRLLRQSALWWWKLYFQFEGARLTEARFKKMLNTLCSRLRLLPNAQLSKAADLYLSNLKDYTLVRFFASSQIVKCRNTSDERAQQDIGGSPGRQCFWGLFRFDLIINTCLHSHWFMDIYLHLKIMPCGRKVIIWVLISLTCYWQIHWILNPSF